MKFKDTIKPLLGCIFNVGKECIKDEQGRGLGGLLPIQRETRFPTTCQWWLLIKTPADCNNNKYNNKLQHCPLNLFQPLFTYLSITCMMQHSQF